MNHSSGRSPVGPIAGPSWLPSVPYPVAYEKGFWSPVTSTINWCEEVTDALGSKCSTTLLTIPLGLLCDNLLCGDC